MIAVFRLDIFYIENPQIRRISDQTKARSFLFQGKVNIALMQQTLSVLSFFLKVHRIHYLSPLCFFLFPPRTGVKLYFIGDSFKFI